MSSGGGRGGVGGNGGIGGGRKGCGDGGDRERGGGGRRPGGLCTEMSTPTNMCMNIFDLTFPPSKKMSMILA